MIKEITKILKKHFPLLTYVMEDGVCHFYISKKYTNVSLHDGNLGDVELVSESLRKEISFYKDKKDPEKYIEQEKVIKRGKNGSSTVPNGSPNRGRSRHK